VIGVARPYRRPSRSPGSAGSRQSDTLPGTCLPAFLAEYAGDTLWALMLFLLVSTLLAGRPIAMRATISLALAFLVEISQLYHVPWIDAIRQTTLGGLVLGFGFLWTDLVCYSIGVMIGVIAEWAIVGRMRVSREA